MLFRSILNYRICEGFGNAKIPVILIDRDICGPFERSRYDLVGIDNFRSSYKITQHLLNNNCKDILFLSRPYSAPTVDQRIAGYQTAMLHAGIIPNSEWVITGEPHDMDFVRLMIDKWKPDAIICANDATAAELMHCLDELKINIPETVAIVGFDDMKYAAHLRVSLTTFRQPCQDIGTAAIKLMLERLSDQNQPVKTVFLEGQLIVRNSCGSKISG